MADEAASVEAARAARGEVHQPEDRAAWEAGAKGVWESLAPVVGGLDAIEAIRAL
ncbi:hypothetical protein [Rhodobacter sp. 24-YEA-8]|uniref:hypothetical protein n=1 Tax=Rhodobacter sp. 24-YEA-8 TaxID=1884310 RepID=UPI001C0B7D8D|nr:hypothetical protein [Rhodobacter sp. 24-YEA-8]